MKTQMINKTQSNGGRDMKKTFMAIMMIIGILFITASAWAEEAGCFQSTDNWLINVYSGGTGPSSYTFSLVVLDTNGAAVPANQIQGLTALGNPYQFEANAQKPDVSLACDAQAGTAYILHDHLGTLSMTRIQDIVKVQTGAPVLQVVPTTVNFGSVTTRTTKNSTVVVTNTGTAALHITTVTSPSAPFSKTADTCNGATIAVSGTCSITIRYAPTVTGTHNGSFSINSDGGNATVTLKGTGVSGGGGGGM